MKSKTVNFDFVGERINIFKIDTLIHEVEPMKYVHIECKVVRKAEMIERKNLKLQEFVVADSSGSMMLTMFEENINLVDVGYFYKLTNVQVTTFLNEKRLRSSHLTEVEMIDEIDLGPIDIKEINESEMNKENMQQSVSIVTVDEESLEKKRFCVSCNTALEGGEKLVRCLKCRKVQLSSLCTGEIKVCFTDGATDFTCSSSKLQEILPDDLSIGNNDDFILFLLSKKFNITHRHGFVSDIVLADFL